MLADCRECLALQVEDAQAGLTASNAKPLAEAQVNPTLTPLAICDVSARGHEEPPTPMVGFVMVELAAGVGFITRLMVDRAYQRRGYGRAAMTVLIHRLRLYAGLRFVP